MRIGAVSSVNSIPNTSAMSAVRTKRTQRTTPSADTVSKKLQNEITDKQQQKNGLSSNTNIPANEKTTKSVELQQGISSLKAQLRRHQIETDKEKMTPDDKKTSAIGEEIAKEAEAKAAREEARKEELKKEEIKKAEKENAAKEEQKSEEAKAAEQTKQDIKSIVSSDAAKNQIEERNLVIAKTEAGIVIKKGEMRQDEMLGANTKDKQEDINAQENRARVLSNISLGPKGINNGAGGMKASNYAIPAQNQNIVHQGNDGLVLIKAG